MHAIEIIQAKGHPNITATHSTTFEITKDKEITKKADCIVAVEASKGARDLSPNFQTLAQSHSTKITVLFEIEGLRESMEGYGHPKLSFRHKSDLVGRKSQFVCDRTLMVKANKASNDFNRKFVEAIKSPDKKIMITLIAERAPIEKVKS